MAGNVGLLAVGYTVLTLLYQHSITTIFNRMIPTIQRDDEGYFLSMPPPAVKSFVTHLAMLRPLEIVFRFITAPLRVLPDVIILGEVRCGTTNLCGHIVALSSASTPSDVDMKIKCYTPFCPWVHPELDHKESFYFVGHYLGMVDPYFYRMAFPLKVNRFGANIFDVFDNAHSHSRLPTLPRLLSGGRNSREISFSALMGVHNI